MTTTQIAPAALAVSDVHVQFGAVQAVDGMSLTVDEGARVGLIGANGAGKSTLVDVICGFRRPDSGSVRLRDLDLTRVRARQFRQLGIGRTFQHCELYWNMTIRDNLLIGAGGDGELAEQLLKRVAIDEFADQVVLDTPYGVQKKTELARALAGAPRLLILDEPAAGLNTDEKSEFIEILMGVAVTSGLGFLIIEHDMSLIKECCSTVYVMDAGRSIFTGTPAEAIANPAVIEAYLGNDDS